MAKIEHYEFGKIVINGKEYNRDVIVFPDRAMDNWWRKEGHNLCLQDIKEIIDYNPGILIIGTGYYGFMNVSKEVIRALNEKGIEVRIAKTKEACKVFNELVEKGRKVVAALHLTC